MPSLESSIGKVRLSGPVIAASGTYGFGKEYEPYCDPAWLGGIASKGLTLQSKLGNTGTRIYETASGIMNSVGLENPGLPAFMANDLPMMAEWDPAIIINLGGSTLAHYEEGAAFIENETAKLLSLGRRGPDMIELNISCPNVKEGGMQFGLECSKASEVVRIVRQATTLPLMVKLSPNARDISEMAEMCEKEGADAISLINTFSAMKINIRERRSVFDQLYAGLSGPAIKPIALRMVHQAAKAVTIPVVGMGGIVTADDAIEFIMAGSAAIQVGTASFMNLRACEQISKGILAWMTSEGIKSLDEIRGII